MTEDERGAHDVKSGMHPTPGPPQDEWQINLVKDGGRRVMYGGNAYEDDLEPAAGPKDPEQPQILSGPEASARVDGHPR